MLCRAKSRSPVYGAAVIRVACSGEHTTSLPLRTCGLTKCGRSPNVIASSSSSTVFTPDSASATGSPPAPAARPCHHPLHPPPLPLLLDQLPAGIISQPPKNVNKSLYLFSFACVYTKRNDKFAPIASRAVRGVGRVVLCLPVQRWR